MTMLNKAKMALRITTNAYDEEIGDLIESAKEDLGIAGVIVPDGEQSKIVTRAILTYCKMMFGVPDDVDKLKRSYDEQKAQLSNATGFTKWGDSNV